MKRKGQAFIVYKDPASALQAIEDVQGFDLFGQEMHLELARSRSDATVKRVATEDDFETHKRRRKAERGGFTGPLGRFQQVCWIPADW